MGIHTSSASSDSPTGSGTALDAFHTVLRNARSPRRRHGDGLRGAHGEDGDATDGYSCIPADGGVWASLFGGGADAGVGGGAMEAQVSLLELLASASVRAGGGGRRC